MTAPTAQQTSDPSTTHNWRVFSGFVCLHHPTFTSTATPLPGYTGPLLQSRRHLHQMPADENKGDEEKWSPGSKYITAVSAQRERGEMSRRGGEREGDGATDLWMGRGGGRSIK